MKNQTVKVMGALLATAWVSVISLTGMGTLPGIAQSLTTGLPGSAALIVSLVTVGVVIALVALPIGLARRRSPELVPMVAMLALLGPVPVVGWVAWLLAVTLAVTPQRTPTTHPGQPVSVPVTI